MLFFACGTRNDLEGTCPSARRLCSAVLGGHVLLQVEGETEPRLMAGTGHKVYGQLYELSFGDMRLLERHALIAGDERKEVVVRKRGWNPRLYRRVTIFCQPVPVEKAEPDRTEIPLAA